MTEQNGSNSIPALFVLVIFIVVLILFGAPVMSLIGIGVPKRLGIDEFYWSYRSLDILAQAFLVFAASIAVAAIFRANGGKSSSEDKKIHDQGDF